jgi:hypothetical protein
MLYRCWAVQCKSDGCGQVIFLDTIGPVDKGKHVVMAPVTDFPTTCPRCNTVHSYSASDLMERDIDDPPIDSPSREFFQALKDGCTTYSGTAGFNDGDGTAVAGVFWHTRGYILDRDGRQRDMETDEPGWYFWFDGPDKFRYLHGPYDTEAEAVSDLEDAMI